MVNASDFLTAFGLGGSGQVSGQSAKEAVAEAQAADNGAVMEAFAEFIAQGAPLVGPTAATATPDIVNAGPIGTNAMQAITATGEFPSLNARNFAGLTPQADIVNFAALPEGVSAGVSASAQKLLAGLAGTGAALNAAPLSADSQQAFLADLLHGKPLLEAGPVQQISQNLTQAATGGMGLEEVAQQLRLTDAAAEAQAGDIITQIAEANGLGAKAEPSVAELSKLEASSAATTVERVAAGDSLAQVQAEAGKPAAPANPTAAQQATAAAQTSTAQEQVSKNINDEIAIDVDAQPAVQTNTAKNTSSNSYQANTASNNGYQPATQQTTAASADVQQTAASTGEVNSLAAAQTQTDRRDLDKSKTSPAADDRHRPKAEDFRLRDLPDLTPRDGRGLPQWAQAGAAAASLESFLGYKGFEQGLTGPMAYSADGTLNAERSLLGNSQASYSPAQASGQVEMAIKKAVKGDINAFTVRLDPAELGRITVKMSFGADGKATAEILASSPETLQMLQQESRSLERALAANGHDVDDGAISFNLDQQQHEQSAGRAFAEAMQQDKLSGQQNAVSEGAPDQAATSADGDEMIWRGPEDLTDPISLEAILSQVSADTGLDVRI